MRVLQISSLVLVLVTSSLAFSFQTRLFTRDDIEYELELPSSSWRAVSRLDVHDHLEFVNGNDTANGYLRLRKVFVAQPSTPSELFSQEEQWELQRLPGYVVCSECKGQDFQGKLRGGVFSYEYVDSGRTMCGRVYYLQLDKRTFYSLRFTVVRDKLAELRREMDAIAQSFQLK